MSLSQQVKRKVIITNKNVKYELTEQSKLHGIIV